MKKIFKLALSLLLIISFTNIVNAFDNKKEIITAENIKDNYMNTNFMQAIMIWVKKDNPNINIEVNIDEDNHMINIIKKDEVIVSYTYNNEEISLNSNTLYDDTSNILLSSISFYNQNMVYAVLDTMGYSTMDLEFSHDEDFNLDMDFYNEYGLLMPEGDTSVFKITLNKDKIDSLIENYGIERPDYFSLVNTEVVKPILTLKKNSSTVNISWAKDDNAIRFKIFRSESKNGTYKKIATVISNSYVDKKVTYGKTYYYKVKSIGEDNIEISDIKSIKIVPAKVKNVKLTSVKTNSIKISYDREKESGYSIERSLDNKKWKVIKTVSNNSVLSYINNGLKANKRYYYRVRAYKKVSGKKVYGPYSDVTSTVTSPTKPSFSIKTHSYESLKLYIKAPKGAVKYIIYRSNKKNGTYTKVATTNVTSYVDHNLSFNKTYYYKIKACNKYNNCSGNSSIVSLKVTFRKPSVSLESKKTVPITIITSGIYNTDGYILYRSTNNKDWVKLTTLNSSISKYEDDTCKKNKTYYYRVKSFKTINGKREYSSYSDSKKIKCLYEKPAIIIQNALSSLEFTGEYKNGDKVLKIYSLSDERIDVRISDGFSFSVYDMEFSNGKLTTEFFDEVIKVQLINNGVLISGSNGDNGVYSKVKDYSFDEYFNDRFNSDDYIETKYNGKFSNDQDEILNLFQKDEESVLLEGELTIDEEKTFIGFELDIKEDKMVYDSLDERYEISVNDDELIIKYYKNDELKYEKTLNKIGTLTKEEIAQSFV